MIINLMNEGLFTENEILFDKKVNFVFGKNGCGKSTMVDLIKEQKGSEYDVRVFQGFESVIGENNMLNTVILGEENTEINNQIQEQQKQIETIEIKIKAIENEIKEPNDNSNNLWCEKKEREKNVNAKKKEIDDFCRESAKKIKEYNIKISSTSYNINDFKKEINNAIRIDDGRIKELEELLKTEIRTANKIHIGKIDFSEELNSVNNILSGKVTEKTHLVRLSGNSEKTQFARQGMRIHKAGEHCAFCGSIISENTLTELQTYFSADEVRSFEVEINNKIEHLSNTLDKYKNIRLDENKFYPDYQKEVKELKEEIVNKREDVINFYNQLLLSLEQKKSNLFSETKQLNLKIPDEIIFMLNTYNEVVTKNNNSNLEQEQDNARSQLRYHYIKEFCEKFRYNIKITELKNLEALLRETNSKIIDKGKEIERYNGEIINVKASINSLQEQTRNEKILAERINKKLNLYVSFKLVHQGNTNDYKVKCLRTNNIRNVTQLSVGEKNILSFLYFMEKLKDDESENRNKCIIFDDPMTSNDDGVQYLIIEELQNLAKGISDNDKLIILTHNSHFYLNVQSTYQDRYKKNRFYHFRKNNFRVGFYKIEKDTDDFKTNYENLWLELKTLYDNQTINAALLFNPIRRIIETYTKFNSVDKLVFLEKVSGAQKLFNVNLHSIDDLEAELNGKTKAEIIQFMKACFEKNNALEHFNTYLGNVEL